MQYVNLGKTGLKVSRVCLGTNMFGAGYVDDARAISVVDEAIERGINFIDTADAYNDGHSERVVGMAVRNRRHDFVVATKGFIPTGPGRQRTRAFRASTWFTPWKAACGVWARTSSTCTRSTTGTRTRRSKRRSARWTGLWRRARFATWVAPTSRAWQLCRALWVSDKLGVERFESVQPEYNLGQRDIELELLPLCDDQGVSVIPYQLLMGGLLAGSYDRDSAPSGDSHMASRHAQRAKDTYWTDATFDMVDGLRAIAAEIGCTPAQLALAWALTRPAVASVIVGASRPGAGRRQRRCGRDTPGRRRGSPPRCAVGPAEKSLPPASEGEETALSGSRRVGMG